MKSPNICLGFNFFTLFFFLLVIVMQCLSHIRNLKYCFFLALVLLHLSDEFHFANPDSRLLMHLLPHTWYQALPTWLDSFQLYTSGLLLCREALLASFNPSVLSYRRDNRSHFAYYLWALICAWGQWWYSTFSIKRKILPLDTGDYWTNCCSPCSMKQWLKPFSENEYC